MRRHWLTFIALGALALVLIGHPGHTTGQMHDGASPKKYPDFESVVKGGKQYDGLFRLFHKDDTVYAEIRPDQFNQPFLCPISIARGMGQGGHMLNFGEQWVLI